MVIVHFFFLVVYYIYILLYSGILIKEKVMKFRWERLEDDPKDLRVISMVFIPDPKHEWEIEVS